MSDRIKAIIDGVIAREGGFVDHPSDPGGATKFGITERVARSNGYRGHMRDLPRSTAFAIYHVQYVVAPNFDDVALIDPLVAEELIDTGVNAGTDRAAKWYQLTLNALNRREIDYRDVAPDGAVGPATLAAHKALQAKRGAALTRRLLLRALDGWQSAHYLALAKDNSKFEDFLPGWLDHRIGNVAA